jgi:hypothetical protein
MKQRLLLLHLALGALASLVSFSWLLAALAPAV